MLVHFAFSIKPKWPLSNTLTKLSLRLGLETHRKTPHYGTNQVDLRNQEWAIWRMSLVERVSEASSEEQANKWTVSANGRAGGTVLTPGFLVFRSQSGVACSRVISWSDPSSQRASISIHWSSIRRAPRDIAGAFSEGLAPYVCNTDVLFYVVPTHRTSQKLYTFQMTLFNSSSKQKRTRKCRKKRIKDPFLLRQLPCIYSFCKR